MKTIPKDLFDNLIKLSREYWQTGDRALLPAKNCLSKKLQIRTGVNWLWFQEFVDSLIANTGFFPGASNEKLYDVLHAMGWEVADEVQES